MYIYYIDMPIDYGGVDQLLAIVIAKSPQECLEVLSKHLYEETYSMYGNDMDQWYEDKHLFEEGIKQAEVFALADPNQTSKVVHYEGP